MGDVQLFRVAAERRDHHRRQRQALASLRVTQAQVTDILDRRRRRDRRKRLLERGAAATMVWFCVFGILFGAAIPWRVSATASLTFTALFCAVLHLTEKLPVEDPGRVRPGRRR